MSDYKDIIGTKVTAVSSNPEEPSTGQVWYNTTDAALRYKKANASGAWSTGGNLNTGARDRTGLGAQTSALSFGGRNIGPNAYIANNELYNGSSWTEVGDLNTARNAMGGVGTSTAGLAFGGERAPGTTSATEEWNGSGVTTQTID